MSIERQRAGFFDLGFVENSKTWAKTLLDLSGENDLSFVEIDNIVDKQKLNNTCWYNEKFENVSTEKEASFAIFDMKMTTKEKNIPIFGLFRNTGKGRIRWTGVEFGTFEKLKNHYVQIVEVDTQEKITPFKIQDGTLESWTKIVDWEGLSRYMTQHFGETKSALEWKNTINEIFKKAFEENKIYETKINENKIAYFELPYKTKDNVRRYFVVDANERTGFQPWYGSKILSEDTLVNDLLNDIYFRVGDFCFEDANEANDFLNTLANRAMKEEWTLPNFHSKAGIDKPILRGYLENTYIRLRNLDRDEKKTIEYLPMFNGKMYMNTGLIDHYFRPLFIVSDMVKIKIDLPGIFDEEYLIFKNPYIVSSEDKEIASNFRENEQPPMAKYFEKLSDVFFDTSIAITINDEHIFVDGLERGRIPLYTDRWEKEKNNEYLKEKLIREVSAKVDVAIRRAKTLAKRNWKLAIPQYWPEDGTIQFLLPLYIDDMATTEGVPQCVLALRCDKSGRVPHYYGSTILTPEMAYNNARLLSTTDAFWLSKNNK